MRESHLMTFISTSTYLHSLKEEKEHFLLGVEEPPLALLLSLAASPPASKNSE